VSVTDLQSVTGMQVDLEAGMWREVSEETGLARDDLVAEPLWYTAISQQRIAHIKVLTSPENADVLGERLRENISQQQEPELADIYVVRCEDDIRQAMPSYVVSFLRSMFSEHNCS
jgi:hypothetical protein